MDHKLFLSAMKHCEYMIGNSSSGYYEAPTLGTEFVNIGNRQKGRKPITGDGKASERIRRTLNAMMLVPKQVLLQKKWSAECPSTQPGNGSTTSANGGTTQRKNLYGTLLDAGVPTDNSGCLTLGQGKGLALGS